MNFFYKIIFFLIIAYSNLSAQYHEIGAFLGGSNYIGDIGPTRYISPNNTAFGLLYKWNLTTRYSLRAGINLSKINWNPYKKLECPNKTGTPIILFQIQIDLK